MSPDQAETRGYIMVLRKRHPKPFRRGVAVLETAMVLSVLVLGIMGIFEYGRIVMVRQLMTNAAQSGARLAVVGTAVQPPVTTAQIIDTVNQGLVGQALSNVNVQVFQADPATLANLGAWDSTPYGGAIAVQLDVDYTPTLPRTMGIVPNPIHFTAVSVRLSEAN